ncbi:hypothetical protein J6590_000948 [Homalodisca vitripennis]|nr:hypothetical protein J6590_000948 [Homalodisca vitripennis]
MLRCHTQRTNRNNMRAWSGLTHSPEQKLLCLTIQFDFRYWHRKMVPTGIIIVCFLPRWVHTHPPMTSGVVYHPRYKYRLQQVPHWVVTKHWQDTRSSVGEGTPETTPPPPKGQEQSLPGSGSLGFDRPAASVTRYLPARHAARRCCQLLCLQVTGS